MTEQSQPSALAGDSTPMTISEAFMATRAPRVEQAAPAENDEDQNSGQAAPSDEDGDGAAPNESADDADAAGQDDPSGEGDGKDDTAGDDLPPIDPPRSWTKEEKKAFEALPREFQQTIAERERDRHATLDRRLNETAKQDQAAKAAITAAEQARKQYEDRLPHLLGAIEASINAEFADIKSWEDVQKMATEEPARYTRWHAVREQQGAIQAEMAAAEGRQVQERTQQMRNFFETESKKFLEAAPEYADPVKGPVLRQQAIETLLELGFEQSAIDDAWNNGGAIPVHSHQFQLLVRDATRYRAAKKAVTKPAAAAKPAPQVQRPGPATSSKDARSEHIKNLDSRLSKTGKLKDALALMRASRSG